MAIGSSPAGTWEGTYTRTVRLVERSAEVGVLRAALGDARDGDGSAVAITGESGVGKSSLVDALAAETVGMRVLRAHCDPLDTPRPLGPFRDLRLPDGADGPTRGDTPLSELCDLVYESVRREPTLLVVEDLHWVDAATVDVLRFLARRVGSMPLLLVVTYRDDEIGPRHSARPLLGDLASLDGVVQLALAPLSVDAVRELVSGTHLEAERVHAVTGGNPFFVAEVAKDPDRPLPGSVRDAVLAHTADVTDHDFEVLQLVAAAPDRLDDRALPHLGVDLPTLRRLQETALLTRTADGLVFRHELARQAIESTIPPGGGSELHARLLDALQAIEPSDPAVLTHHAVAARDHARATSYARRAAEDASAAGSHSEAAAFFEIALEHLESSDPEERARLLLDLAYQQYMTSRLSEAISNVRATFRLWEQAKDQAGLADAHAAVALFEYYNAHRARAEHHSDSAARIALDAATPHTYGAARATQGFLAYLRNDLEQARELAAEARDLAERNDLGLLGLRSEVVATVSDLVSGDEAARTRLLTQLEAARDRGWDELASTVYSQVASLDVEHGRLRDAEQLLQVSIPFASQRDIPICRHWQTGVRARLQFQRGRWEAALEDAATVIGDEGMPLATLWPRLVSVLVPLRRGERAELGILDDAWSLAEQIDEPLRRLSVLGALAEAAWMTGRSDPRVSEYAVAQLAVLGSCPGAEWGAGHVGAWLRRLGLPVPEVARAAEPYRLVDEGRVAEAARWWRRLGDPFAEATAWTDSAVPEDRARGIRLLDSIGAVGTADRHRVALRQEGSVVVPQRPRESTRANPAGLTNRQLEVARLVARGLSNSEIAAELFISPKTADHHVSAVLTKLGVPHRRAVVVDSARFGLT
ncbi:MAG TPA: AAA family ATPase [Nocardioides sp.]|nr:AAA family ATPase [Nocardioides sp.]